MVLTTFTKHRGFQTEEHDIGHRKSQGAREKDWLPPGVTLGETEGLADTGRHSERKLGIG